MWRKDEVRWICEMAKANLRMAQPLDYPTISHNQHTTIGETYLDKLLWWQLIVDRTWCGRWDGDGAIVR